MEECVKFVVEKSHPGGNPLEVVLKVLTTKELSDDFYKELRDLLNKYN